MSTNVAAAPVDVNEKFAAERASQVEQSKERAADTAARIADGRLVNLGGGRYKVNDPGSWDNGEILTVASGMVMPQHGLDETRGSVALYSAVPAWHELGNIIPGGTSDVEQVLKLGGIDYDVITRPVMFRETDSSWPNPLANYYVTMRTDTGAGLGVVGKRYEVIQNRAAFDFLQELVDTQDVVWESAGALRDGKRVFVALRMPDTITIDAGGVADEIIPFIVAMNSHDASSPFQVVVTPWRPVCGNTERFAVRDASARWAVRHTANALERVDEALRTLGLTTRYFAQWVAEEEALARQEMAIGEFHNFLGQLWTAPDEDSTEKAQNNWNARVELLSAVYGENAKTLGYTAYAAERTITEFADWRKTIRPTGSLQGKNLAARATAMLEGSDDELKTRAHRELLTLTRGGAR